MSSVKLLRRDVLRHAGIDDHDARADADLESLRGVEGLQRLLRHEEHRVAVLLRAGLESVGGAGRVVVADRLAATPEHAFAELAANAEAGLGDVGEYEHRDGLWLHCLGRRDCRDQLLQGLLRRSFEIGLRCRLRLGGRGDAQREGECGDEGSARQNTHGCSSMAPMESDRRAWCPLLMPSAQRLDDDRCGRRARYPYFGGCVGMSIGIFPEILAMVSVGRSCGNPCPRLSPNVRITS